MVRRVGIVSLLILGCAVTHFLIPHHPSPWHAWHEFLFKVTYVPIILAAFWFGLRGGLTASAVTSALYLLHIELQLGGQLLTTNLGSTLDLALYNVFAAVTGRLSDLQMRARHRAEQLAEEQTTLRHQLEESYAALRKQTAALLETTEQLHHAGRLVALGELTAGIAHEIRNPLSGISGAAEIVAREDVPPAARAEFLGIMRKEIQRLDQVVQNILNFARAHKTDVQETNVAEVVQRVTGLVSRDARRQSVAVVLDVPGDLRAHTDPILLEHILLNLALNGVQAMPTGGTVTLSGRMEGAWLRLAVRDTGPGIPAEAQPRIFTPFFTTKPGGTGLGLAIAQRIAHGLGGEIRLTSVAGQGAEFVLALPSGLPSAPRVVLFGSERETDGHGLESVASRGQ